MLKEQLDLEFRHNKTTIYYNLEIGSENCSAYKINLNNEYLCMIDLIITDEEYRNLGSGKEAIREFIKYMNLQNVYHFYLFASFDKGYYKEININSLKRLVNLYKSFGFKPYKKNIFNNNEQIDMYLYTK